MYFIDLFCRFESFNSFIRAQNVYSNRRAPSRDIAYNFSVLEHIRAVCSGAQFNNTSSKRHVLRFVTNEYKFLTDLSELIL